MAEPIQYPAEFGVAVRALFNGQAPAICSLIDAGQNVRRQIYPPLEVRQQGRASHRDVKRALGVMKAGATSFKRIPLRARYWALVRWHQEIIAQYEGQPRHARRDTQRYRARMQQRRAQHA